ncbi:DUF3135 domain-containing protein [Thermodesulfobacteriota bacterium]
MNAAVEREKRKEAALAEHARLHRLFKEDRLSFERERKQAIDELINNTRDPEQREKLRALQDSWDSKMKHAGSQHNRFVLAQFLFWRHVNEGWQPAFQKYNAMLNGESPEEG